MLPTADELIQYVRLVDCYDEGDTDRYVVGLDESAHSTPIWLFGVFGGWATRRVNDCEVNGSILRLAARGPGATVRASMPCSTTTVCTWSMSAGVDETGSIGWR